MGGLEPSTTVRVRRIEEAMSVSEMVRDLVDVA